MTLLAILHDGMDVAALHGMDVAALHSRTWELSSDNEVDISRAVWPVVHSQDDEHVGVGETTLLELDDVTPSDGLTKDVVEKKPVREGSQLHGRQRRMCKGWAGKQGSRTAGSHLLLEDTHAEVGAVTRRLPWQQLVPDLRPVGVASDRDKKVRLS